MIRLLHRYRLHHVLLLAWRFSAQLSIQNIWDDKFEAEARNVFINDETLIAFFRFHFISSMIITLCWRNEDEDEEHN